MKMGPRVKSLEDVENKFSDSEKRLLQSTSSTEDMRKTASRGELSGRSKTGSSPSIAGSPRVPRLSRPSSRELIMEQFSANKKPESDFRMFTHNVTQSGTVMTRIEFQVSVETHIGDQVMVTGSCNELGSWQPCQGVVMATEEITYPLWTGVAEIPSGLEAQYKYVVMSSTGELRWEADIDNRMFTAEGTMLVLEDGQFNVERARLLNKDFVSLERACTGGRTKMMNFTEIETSIEKTDTLYVVTYRLPLTTHRDPETGKLSFQWLSMLSDSNRREMNSSKVMRSMSRHATYVIENLRILRSKCNVCYVGGLGIDISAEEQEAVTEELAQNFNCIPVFLDPDQRSEFEDFCYDILKPIFHFVHPTGRDIAKAFSAGAKWQLYNTVNSAYVKSVVQNFNDGDCVFVFDLELLLTPTLIGSRARTANICFFFNTPFPSSEIFRAIPVRKEILRALLNADFIQFHDYTYARHFMSCCSTLLGLEYKSTRGGLLNIVFNGHHCHIRASHTGIDVNQLEVRLREEQIGVEQQKWRQKFAQTGKQVILCGYDDMEPLSGITLKLEAFRSLLRLHPEFRSNTLLVQVAIPLYDNRANLMHPEYVEQVKSAAAEIEKDYPGSLLMMHEKMPFAPRCALFSQADALVNAAVRHGLTLVPFEFVLCTELGEKKGNLILSEFSACGRVIPGAVRVNPWRDEDLARAIVKTLRQPAHESMHWHTQQMAWCKTNTVERWTENILLDMKRIRIHMIEMGEDVNRSASVRVGLVKNSYKEISSRVLKHEIVFNAYTNTKTRLLLLDIDLLIRPKEELDDEEKEKTLRSLQQLVQEQGNFLFLLSSESPDNLLKWLGKTKGLEKLGLAAEDGYYYKWPGSPVDRWDIRMEVQAYWKEVAHSLMKTYVERTTGTFIEHDKIASITWHFGSTSPEFGLMQGKELLNHLKDTMAHLPVEVFMGKSFVRVRHKDVSKGSLVQHIVSHYSRRGGVDFILCLGDDKMDQDMFNILQHYQHEASYRVFQGEEQAVKVFTVTVGKQPSHAAYCLYTLDDVNTLLGGVSLQTKRKIRASATMLELSGFAA